MTTTPVRAATSSAAEQDRSPRGRLFRSESATERWVSILSPIVLLVLWELAARLG